MVKLFKGSCESFMSHIKRNKRSEKMIKKIGSCIREYKKESLLAPTFVSMEVVLEVLIPFFMASLIDNGINQGNMSYIMRMGLLLLVFAGTSLTFGILSGRYAALASAGLAKNIRHDVFYNVQEFSFANIDEYSTSSLISRLTTDVSNVQMAYQMVVRVLVRAPIMLSLSFFMVCFINLRIALIYLILTPLLGLGLYFIITSVYPIFTSVFKRYDRLNTVVQENLHGTRVVKSFVREKHEIEKFSDVSDAINQDFIKAEKLVALTTPLMQFIIYSCLLLVSWFGAQLVVTQTMTTGELMSIFMYTNQIFMSLMMLANVLVMVMISKPSVDRIAEVIEAKSDLTNGDQPVYQVEDGSITFENVSFSYSKDSEKMSLSDVDLRIEAGTTVGVIGGTGSAKTSLVQLIPRLYDATKGIVKVGGVDVREYDLESLRHEVAMVLQKNVLFSGTIKENLRWGNLEASDAELKRVCQLAQADEFIEAFPDGYETHIEQGGTNVSGGQRQRLCIARALLKKPKILILDDSTSALDTKTDALIRKAFVDEIPNTTKIIIAQRISSIESADKIVVMNEGQVSAVGTHDELLEGSQIYREVYDSQQKGVNENGQWT